MKSKRMGSRRDSEGSKGSSTPTLVYIHGIGNQESPSTLKRLWDRALFGVDMGARTRMAYWADLLYSHPLDHKGAEGRSTAFDEEKRMESSQGKRSSSQQRYEEAVAKRLMERCVKREETQAKSVEAKLFPLPSWLRERMTEQFTRIFVKDSAVYFFDSAKRKCIQQRLSQILISSPGPYILIGHSLGSVIAYDILRALENKKDSFKVSHLVTLGSPLGIDEVQDFLPKPLRFPKEVQAWQNFSDLLDPVALDKGLGNEFSPKGKIDDHLVVNRYSLSMADFNPHSSLGYLETTQVRRVVQKMVGPNFADLISDFVVARDLANDMVDSCKRHPVLIEMNYRMPGESLNEKRDFLVQELRRLTRDSNEARIDPLRRFVAVQLTTEEIDSLSSRYRDLEIARFWKNSEKRALLDKSTHIVQAYTAHQAYGATGKGVAWAVLDTGIRADHPHFQTHQNIAAQWDCTKTGSPVKDDAHDANGHGSHVAGIIAGTSSSVPEDKTARISGVAPEAKLHIYKVLDDHGSGQDSFIIKALDHIAQLNESSPNPVIHGINLSLGGPFDVTVYACGHSPLCRELRRLWRQGVVVCIAAGNEGRLEVETSQGQQEINLDLSIGDPANLEEAIAVGSVHREFPHLYGISYFSSRGPTADGRIKPDVVAPGERIVSCNARFEKEKSDTFYIPMSGTSMACPHISGVIAAFLSVRREFLGHPDQVKEILLGHCLDLKRDRYHQGAGIPNLVRMLAGT